VLDHKPFNLLSVNIHFILLPPHQLSLFHIHFVMFRLSISCYSPFWLICLYGGVNYRSWDHLL